MQWRTTPPARRELTDQGGSAQEVGAPLANPAPPSRLRPPTLEALDLSTPQAQFSQKPLCSWGASWSWLWGVGGVGLGQGGQGGGGGGGGAFQGASLEKVTSRPEDRGQRGGRGQGGEGQSRGGGGEGGFLRGFSLERAYGVSGFRGSSVDSGQSYGEDALYRGQRTWLQKPKYRNSNTLIPFSLDTFGRA